MDFVNLFIATVATFFIVKFFSAKDSDPVERIKKYLDLNEAIQRCDDVGVQVYSKKITNMVDIELEELTRDRSPLRSYWTSYGLMLTWFFAFWYSGWIETKLQPLVLLVVPFVSNDVLISTTPIITLTLILIFVSLTWQTFFSNIRYYAPSHRGTWQIFCATFEAIYKLIFKRGNHE